MSFRAQALNRVTGKLCRSLDQLQLLWPRFRRSPVIHRKGPQHDVPGIADRHTPAGMQTVTQHEVFGFDKVWVSPDILYNDCFIQECCCTASSDHGSDFETIDCRQILGWKAW